MKHSLGALLIAFALPAAADFDPSAYPRYETCALCHGLEGQSRMFKFPHLAGQRPEYIRAQLAAFLAGERTNDGGQMAAIVTELEAGDIPVVVAWFSGQPPPPAGDAPTDATGRQVFEAAGCGGCHTNSSDGAPEVPYLTAQHARYLVKQMEDFRDARRTHSDVADLHRELLNTHSAAIDQIAAYLASTGRGE